MRIAAISAISLARQTRNKRQNHENGKTTTEDKREPEDNVKRGNTDQPTMVPTPSARQTKSQATADSRKRKELNERQKDTLKRT